MAGESTGFNAAPSAQAALPGAAPTPSSAGKGGGGGSLPMSEYPFVPQWMQQRSQSPTGASNAVTPAINPGQGAGRFMGQSPAAAPQGTTNLMGGGGTPTATPVVRATQAGTTFRPTVTPSIYDEWKGYNAAAQKTMSENPPPMTTAEAIAAFNKGKITRQKYEEAMALARGEDNSNRFSG